MSKYKAMAIDGGVVFGDSIRWDRWGWWLVSEGGETLFDPKTIEDLSDRNQQISKYKAAAVDGKMLH